MSACFPARIWLTGVWMADSMDEWHADSMYDPHSQCHGMASSTIQHSYLEIVVLLVLVLVGGWEDSFGYYKAR